MSFSEKSLITLELPAVLDMLSHEAVSDAAKERALALTPSADAAEVKRRQEETSAAKTMMTVRQSPSFAGVKDVRASLSRADLGGALNTRELMDIARVLQCARLVRGYIADDSVGKTCIDHLFYALRANKFLEEKISTSVVGEDEIADSASPELANIRRQMRAAAARARDALQKIISSPSYAKVLQEPIITMRSDRYVVPVKAECKGAVQGLVHDVSASGMTVFVEPMAAVKANNELRELAAKEKLEIDRILAELSADCAEHRDDIECDFDVLVRLDLIFAKARLSYKLDCQQAGTDGGHGIVLRRARHPLLDQSKAVPISLELGNSFDTLVVTGPNTGGKTVSLKTIGLLAAMNQCGLHIPAADGSSLPVFSHILADIGDEQSIEQSLSTFSAHMKNIVQILDEADEHSLILFDELGAGTDPVEGAALAIAVIEQARAQGAKIAATTHYAELKTFAMTTAGVENASCEFDVETLCPTYRLLIGIPGKSNAFAISKRLGLSESVIEKAKAQMDSESIRFEDVLTQLEQKRQQLEKEKVEVDRLYQQREEDARKAREFRTQMERAKENARSRGEAEAKRLLAEAKSAADETFRALDALRKEQRKLDAQQMNAQRAQIMHGLKEARESVGVRDESAEPIPRPSRPIRAGDLVEIPGTKRQAEVTAVKGEVLALRAGALQMRVKADEVRLIEDDERAAAKKKTPQFAPSQRILHAAAAARELDIRGMETLEAESVLASYIDSAVLAHLETVTIIHGKGTGALRKAVHEQLRRNKAVKSFRLGNFGEGESGVTVVELK